MAIIKKDKYLKDIATRIGRGSVYFEEEDRPMLLMGGRQVYVASVGYDFLLGEMAYTVSNDRGDILPSAHGARRLAELDFKTLSKIGETVNEYSALRRERSRNMANIQARVGRLSENRRKGVTL